MSNGKIFVMGAGAMAEAFIRGVTGQGACVASDIVVANRSRSHRLDELAKSYGITPAIDYTVVREARLVVLAVKPWDVADALSQLQPLLHGQPVMSFAAGVPISFMRHLVDGRSPIVRTMPNIPVAVLSGVTAVSFANDVLEADRAFITYLLGQVGGVVEIPEHMMDAATAFSGSGPGFVSYFLEAMEDAAVRLGFTPELAREFLLQTVVGTAKTLSEWGLSPRELRERVTSPNGTTYAGVRVMEASDLSGVVRQALQAAARRSEEMGRVYSV